MNWFKYDINIPASFNVTTNAAHEEGKSTAAFFVIKKGEKKERSEGIFAKVMYLEAYLL